jgi:alkylhydroperoxidase family enzyme
LAEAVTRLAEDAVPDAAFKATRAHFTTTQIAELTLAVAAMNAQNRGSM